MIPLINSYIIFFMSPIEFDDLKLDEKARIIFSKGSFVSKVMFFQLGISLYRINDKFVEIWYNTPTGTVRKVDYLNDKEISPYIKHLHMPSLN